MAVVDALGNLQPEPGDILPREIARREDDPQEVIELIEKLNPSIETAEDLAQAVEQVDELRRELASKANQDNPHLNTSIDDLTIDPSTAPSHEETASKPSPDKLGKNNKKGPTER